MIGDLEPTLPGVAVEFRPWSAATEAAELAQTDIGVNWLPDDSWSLGKCGLRVLQYMAAGLPVVVNPVGMNRKMVIHGQTGFWASTPREWAEAITRLADAPLMRQRMGAAGRRLVEKEFDVAAWGPRMAAAIDALARDVQHCRCFGVAEAMRSAPADSQGEQGGMTTRRGIIRCLCLFFLLAGLAGCAVAWQNRAVLPERFSAVRQPIALHSDSEIPGANVLLDELVAEQGELCRRLGLPALRQQVHVYVFDDAEKLHKFIQTRHPTFPDRRAFFVETEKELAIYAQKGDRLAEDLRHEMTHAYLHSALATLPPLWLDEGLAKYFEVPPGRHGLNRQYVQQIADAMRKGAWHPNLRRLERLDPAGDMSQEDYVESWAWIHYLLESQPPQADLLRQYLADLREKHVPVDSFTMRLTALVGHPEWELLEHVRLAATACGPYTAASQK